MPINALATLPGNLSEFTYLAWPLAESSGDFYPSNAPGVPLLQTEGSVAREPAFLGTAIRIATGGDPGPHLSLANDVGLNAFGVVGGVRAVSIWSRFDSIAAMTTINQRGVGVFGGGGQQQWRLTPAGADQSSLRYYFEVTGSGATRFVQGANNSITPLSWIHTFAQFRWNGLSGGAALTELRMHVNGVLATSYGGTAAIVPQVVTERFRIGKANGWVQTGALFAWPILMSSSLDQWVSDDTVAALYNNGAGLDFVRGGPAFGSSRRLIVLGGGR